MKPSMIRVEQQGSVATLWFDAPQQGNALDRVGVADLRQALRSIGGDVELILFRGTGGRAFCGGANSREMVGLPPDDRRAALDQFGNACLEIWEHRALTVAVLDGYAIGGGAHVAMACDMRVMTPRAFLQFPSSGYGLNITTVWLTLLVGPANAAWMMASARRIDASEALRLGLTQAIAEGDDALSALGLDDRSGLVELKAAIREAIPPHVAGALRAEHARAVELVGLDRFVAALSREKSVTSGRRAESDSA